MKTLATMAVLLVAAMLSAQAQPIDSAKIDAMIAAAFPTAPADWRPRLDQDETMKQCSMHHNLPPKAVGDAIMAREKARIEYPADGQLIGDWKKGEAVAQSGYGLRFTDYPQRQPIGGNCYACHQLTRAEVSYGTIGPSLLNYGKIRNFGEAETKAVYDKIYNAQVSYPCSNMPRLGTHKVLTIEQIKDLVALVMSPDSPVNK
jgi:sulfur-oxidizing protein SoxX